MACDDSRRSAESPAVAAAAAGEGAAKQGGEQRRQKLWEMYDRMRDKLFTDVPEMDVTELHQLLLAQQAAGGGEGLGTNGEADGGVGRGEVGEGGLRGEAGGGEAAVGGGESGRGGRRVVVVDTRTEEESAVSMIPGGTLKQSDFERQMGRFSDHQVVCYCTIGYRSGNYARMLHSHHSMHAANLKGSILAWTHHRLPLTSLYHPQTGSGPLPILSHANTSANTSTAHESTSQHDSTAACGAGARGKGATGSGAATDLPVLPLGLGATTRVHVYSPKYELHADGYQPAPRSACTLTEAESERRCHCARRASSRLGAPAAAAAPPLSPRSLSASPSQPPRAAAGSRWSSRGRGRAEWERGAVVVVVPLTVCPACSEGPALVKASASAGRVVRIPRHLGGTARGGRRPAHAAMALINETASNEDGRSGEAEKARGEEEARMEKVDKSSDRKRRGEAGGREKGEQESVGMTRQQWELVAQVDGGGRLVPVHVRRVGSSG
ncbi:unnamed protein product [Closterium sp. NIES-65]|nr:unnamed protein product [Closterium sp. NIES-65]